MNRLSALLTLILVSVAAHAAVLRHGEPIRVSLDEAEAVHVKTAFGILESDLHSVLGAPAETAAGEADIIVGTLGVNPLLDTLGLDYADLRGRHEGFMLESLPDGRIVIAGSDSHGTMYGMMELSRMLGVSPWEWWADVTPQPKDSLEIPAGFRTIQSPSVRLRGIFINDEDWGLMPWSGTTFEAECGLHTIGPRTNAKIFELMTRLRANYYWPAMHECTRPFFLTPGNREVAERYGIYIGGSHCEPMASSTAGEWPARGKGAYDYINNRDSVYDFWEQRVREVAGQEIVYTLGMRGVHDSKMLGAKSVEEQKEALGRVLADQRGLIARHVNKDVEEVPQVFIPYKEVLDVYNAGLEVPDDVTLMWCDDNYGYIRHFPTEIERARKGGNGIYYHVSYWGRPHDYLWLCTFSPYLLWQQMSMAYDRGIRDMWILNVGDIKPAEYQTELFMDMAWDMDGVRARGVRNHQAGFYAREFGDTLGGRIATVMDEHYRLAQIRKPEFMGGTRTEEADRKYWSTIRDIPWTEREVRDRLSAYMSISDNVEAMWRLVPDSRKDAFFQLVKYPVQGAAQMNVKTLAGQLARYGKASWAASDMALDSIIALTYTYNEGIANNGKWRGIMSHEPRKLAVFGPVPHEEARVPYPYTQEPLMTLDGMDAAGECTPHPGLGHGARSVALHKGEPVTFTFDIPAADSLAVELMMLPTHPVEGDALSMTVSINGSEPRTVNYATQGRSEEWKQNILRGQAVRRITFSPAQGGKNKVTLTPLTEGVVIDRMAIYRNN